MGRADDYQFDYLDDNIRFADQVNGALFHGRQVVKPEELEPADAQIVYLGKEKEKNRDIFDEYHTGLRQLFEVVRYGNDKEELKKFMEENREAYSRMDSKTKELLEVVAGVKIREDNKIMRNGEETYDLCKAFVDMKLEGVEEGKKKEEKKGSRNIW